MLNEKLNAFVVEGVVFGSFLLGPRPPNVKPNALTDVAGLVLRSQSLVLALNVTPLTKTDVDGLVLCSLLFASASSVNSPVKGAVVGDALVLLGLSPSVKPLVKGEVDGLVLVLLVVALSSSEEPNPLVVVEGLVLGSISSVALNMMPPAKPVKPDCEGLVPTRLKLKLGLERLLCPLLVSLSLVLKGLSFSEVLGTSAS